MSQVRSRGRRTTRYGEIEATLRRQIESGRHEVGDSLPTEAELCAQFNVSRFTAREALRRLAEAGYVTRRHGSGTTVIAQHPGVRYSMTLRSEDGLLLYGEHTALIPVTSWAPAGKRHRTALDLPDDRDWFVIEGVRRESPGGRAIGVTTIAADAALGPGLRQIDIGAPGAVFTRLAALKQLRVESIEQEIHAASMLSRVARRLGAETGSPALVITRRLNAAGHGLFEVSQTVHAAEHFRWQLTLQNDAVSTSSG